MSERRSGPLAGIVDRIGGVGTAAVGTAVAAAAAVRLSPWPAALAIRAVFDRGAARASAALAPHAPTDLVEVLGEAYAVADPDGRLDVFRPDRTEPLPTVVWVHGGAFVSGSKDDVANYLRVLAGRGVTAVGVDYSIAPRKRYPTPVRQVAAALAHLVDHADRLGVDPSRIVLAGDSAGAQIAAQVASLWTDPAYAARVGIDVDLPPSGLRGVVLFCGAFDFELSHGSTKLGAWLVDTALWSYLGTRDHRSHPASALASVPQNVTGAFPPAFVSAGNADPLLAHSLGLVAALDAVGAPHETLFFADDHEPRLGHEFQFDLDTEPGRLALDRAVAFIERVTAD
ncbi:MAG TPA: alpha/beta hydrolase [Humibacillus xanthopallidus]|nr:alpha/beta hydrolase [Humibacillus xanthopallidus]